MTKAIVYGLHAGDGVIRYVGSTSQPIEKRVSDHMGEVRLSIKRGLKLNKKQRWIEKVLKKGGRIEGTILFKGNPTRCARKEVEYIGTIPNLTNKQKAYSGGRPVGSKDSEAARARKREAWAANRDERCAITSAALKAWGKRNPDKLDKLRAQFLQASKEWRKDPSRMEAFRKNAVVAQNKRYIESRTALGYPRPELPAGHPLNEEHRRYLRRVG